MPASVRKTSSALKLRTDASMRFEKSQDPVNTVRGLARAVELLQMVSPGIRVVGGVADTARPLRTPEPITLPLDWLYRKLGREMPADEVRQILEALEFGVTEQQPRCLFGDRPVMARDQGHFDQGRSRGRGRPHDRVRFDHADIAAAAGGRSGRRIPSVSSSIDLRKLVAAQGFHEVYNYSFLSEETVQQFGFDPADHVKVLNPIAADQGLMRKSLVPGIWKNIVDNSRFSDEFRLFEIGREIHKRTGELPDEVNHLCAAVYFRETGAQGLFDLKRLAECIAPGCEIRPTTALPYEHPARTGEV